MVLTKQELTKLLEEKKYNELIEKSARDLKGVYRKLIGLAYDKEDIVCWRAIEAIGLLSREAAKSDPESVRTLAQRLLWMMREESGNNPWSAPEMLGELVRNNPDRIPDIAPVILSFHDELILMRGVLRAAVRIAEIRPDLVAHAGTFIGLYFRHADPTVRFYAVTLAGKLGLERFMPDIEGLVSDKEVVKIYDSGEFVLTTPGVAAEKVCAVLKREES